VIVAAARTRPEKLGLPLTHWSVRKLAGYLARRPLWNGLGAGRWRLAHGLARVGETLARYSVAIATARVKAGTAL
jgi:hypothetical protein